jgi:hypothetical protein
MRLQPEQLRALIEANGDVIYFDDGSSLQKLGCNYFYYQDRRLSKCVSLTDFKVSRLIWSKMLDRNEKLWYEKSTELLRSWGL